MMTHDTAILTPPPPEHDMRAWLAEVYGAPDSMHRLAGDASPRTYFRAVWGGESHIAMHSPPAEKLPQFLAIARRFREYDVRAPRIIAEDENRGVALLEDFGGVDYLSALAPDNADDMYAAAWRTLINIQSTPFAGLLPDYDEALLNYEIDLYVDWYCPRLLKRPLSGGMLRDFNKVRAWLINAFRSQTQLFVHRDYHSRNLMVCEGSPGVLDFQDSVIGPATYDIVSLLRDAYVMWPHEKQMQWLEQYRREAFAAGVPVSADEESFRRDFNVAGAQRGLKVLGIFARLYLRDKKAGYLPDMPRVQKHLLSACEGVPELKILKTIVEEYPPPCAP